MVMQRAVLEARDRMERNRFGESEELEHKVKLMSRHFLKSAEKEPKARSKPSWGQVMKKTSDPVFVAPGWVKESVVIESMASRIFSLQSRLEIEQRKAERLASLQSMVGDTREQSFKQKKQSLASYANDRKVAFTTLQAFFQAWRTVCLQAKLKRKEGLIDQASRRAKKFEEDCYRFDFTDKWANKIDLLLKSQRRGVRRAEEVDPAERQNGASREVDLLDEESRRDREMKLVSWLKAAPVLSLPLKVPDAVAVRTVNPTHESCRGFIFAIRANSHPLVLTEIRLAAARSTTSQNPKIAIKVSKILPIQDSSSTSQAAFSSLSIDKCSPLPVFNLLDQEPRYGPIAIRQGVTIPARSQRLLYVSSKWATLAVRGSQRDGEVVDKDSKGFVEILAGKAMDVDESRAIKVGMRDKVVCFCGELFFELDRS